MALLETFKISLVFLGFVVGMVLFGTALLRRCSIKLQDVLQDIAISYLVGVGIFLQGLIIFGLCGVFNRTYIFGWLGLIALLTLVLIRKQILTLRAWQFPKIKIRVLGVVLGFLILVNYFACFAPPIIWDEIAYHLPEAQSIVTTQRLSFPVLGDMFYGNLPMAMEVLYAFAVVVSGTSFMHLIHYSFLLALVAFVVSFLKNKYGTNLGVLGGILIFFLTELVGNATCGYVDAAAVATEVIGLLLLVQWVEQKNDALLYLTAFTWGMSLGIKYSALYTIPVYFLVMALRRWHDGWKVWGKRLGIMVICGLVAGGFWYLKNVVINHNPFYPFFFGHSGLSNEYLVGQKLAIQGTLADRSWLDLFTFPYQVFVEHSYRLSEFMIFILFVVAVVAIILKKYRTDNWYWLIIVGINSAVWFLVISSQTRFLMSTLIVVIILAIAGLNSLIPKQWFWLSIILAGSVLPGIVFLRLPNRDVSTILINLSPIRAAEVKLALGIMSQEAYLSRNVGGPYLVTNYINTNFHDETIINYWNPLAYYYLQHGNLYSASVPDQTEEYQNFIAANTIHYLFVDGPLRPYYVGDPGRDGWWQPRAAFEAWFIAHADVVYSNDTYVLYKIR